MQQQSAQVRAYLAWSKARGLRFPHRRPTLAQAGAVAEVVDASSPPAKLRVLCVGDVPFTSEERALLDRMLAAMHLAPADVAVTNLVPAATADAALAQQQLREQFAARPPELLVLLGAWTVRTTLGAKSHFHALRGRISATALGPMLATYHPRDLLRYPGNKRLAWADLQVAMGVLGLAVGKSQ